MLKTLLAAIAGAAGAYFLDPDGGRRRRQMTQDRIAAFFRRRGRDLGKQARYVSGVVEGAAHEVTPGDSEKGVEELGDPALARKVESEVFRPADAPKGSVNVNVEDGVVYLRGEVESPERIDGLVKAAREVKGVRDVQNLLHLPGEPAPSKTDAGGG